LSSEAQRWVVVAHILRPRGNKGEIAAELLTDFPERLTKVREIYVGAADEKTPPRRVGLQSCWLDRNHPGQIVFHFEGFSSIGEAEKLRGLDVLLPFEQRVSLPTGQYFVTDLIGCAVFELAQEQPKVSSSPCSLGTVPMLLGKVRDVQFTGEDVAGTPLLSVDTANGELQVPLAEDICKRIDTLARRIEVVLPEGLRELNRE
jgi:16S rRNA processing protein RimM